jgi:tRNA A37 threonylcarbamoyladenosine dehydratase
MDIFSRTELLIGADGMERLKNARVAVFGIGGVGGYVCEMLVRSGIYNISLFDSDTVSTTNRNRQIIALESTTGKPKVEVMRDRILDINPDAKVTINNVFYTPENADDYPISEYDYIADCVDTVSSKIELIVRAKQAGVKIISAMGAGNKLDPTRFEVADIYKTSVCPLARTMRYELRKRGIKSLKTVYSKEEPRKPLGNIDDESFGRHIPASVAFAPAAMGIVMASEIIRELSNID